MNHNDQPFQFSLGVLVYPLSFALTMWMVLWLELKFGYNFTEYGVRPNTFEGLRGILFSPFIHSGVTHLLHNTVPIIVLSMALFYFYRPISWKVLLLIWLLSGFGTWAIGRPAYHIGMSSVIYGLVSFLFFKGIIAKHFRLVALSLVVVFLYGSLIWGTMPTEDGVSWEGHLAGFVVGGLLALRFRASIPKAPKYKWEKPEYNPDDDPFMRQFDENGNFFELPKEEGTIDVDYEEIDVKYTYKEQSDEGKRTEL